MCVRACVCACVCMHCGIYIYIFIYKDTYSPMTFKCTQEFVLETFRSYSALTSRTLQIQLAMYTTHK